MIEGIIVSKIFEGVQDARIEGVAEPGESSRTKTGRASNTMDTDLVWPSQTANYLQHAALKFLEKQLITKSISVRYRTLIIIYTMARDAPKQFMSDDLN